MDLSAEKVYETLSLKGIDSFYHANSVATSCNFLREGALLSRGAIERAGLYQTEQSSDAIDKRTGLWFDVFVDSVDIHERAKKKNVYGPVLLVFDSKVISEQYVGKVWLTKLNPTKWKGRTKSERWFQSIDEVKSGFSKGTFDHMIVLRHCGGQLTLKKHLKKIILDDSGYHYPDDKIDFYSLAYGALKASMFLGGIDVPIEKRKCPKDCKCKSEYEADEGNIDKMFIPSRH